MPRITTPAREREHKRTIARKRQQRMFAFTNEAFFPVRRWKLSKQLLGGLALAAAVQYAAFAPPATQAAPNADSAAAEEYVRLASGIPVTAEDAALLKQKLLIKEHKKAHEEKDFVMAALPREAAAPNKQPVEALETVTETRSLGIRTMTAYNSDPAQTDDTPCITANGFNVCEHGIEDTVAANFLPFGTKIRIPELFGERIFIVRDRMNTRYPHRVDVWMLDYGDARQFGVRRAEIMLVID